jgi:hypothetical protein
MLCSVYLTDSERNIVEKMFYKVNANHAEGGFRVDKSIYVLAPRDIKEAYLEIRATKTNEVQKRLYVGDIKRGRAAMVKRGLIP